MRLTVEKACELLAEAQKAFPTDALTRHCKAVGDTAAVIAKAIGLEDPEYARALGYVHDIGKCVDPTTPIKHDIDGFYYLQEKGIDEQDAFICLTHSFINGDYTCQAGGIPEKHPLRCEVLQAHEYNLYEHIINLCDLMCLFNTMTVEKRMMDLLTRKGIHENTHYHLMETMKLKKKFEEMLGHSLYDLFPEIEI